MSVQIQHDTTAQQFSTLVDGQVCELDYRLADGVMTITHTGVPASIGGRGIAASLMRAALAAARADNWKVVPACAYAAHFMRSHPEFDDLRHS